MTCDTSHGWVLPRADGARALCGGPSVCSTCQTEKMHDAMLTSIFGPAEIFNTNRNFNRRDRPGARRTIASPTPQGETMQLQLPPLAEGEIYVGAIGDQLGSAYHLILLPGDNDDASWKDQMAWAKSIGGDLPNKVEQAMLWNTCRDQFQKDWYWSDQAWELDSSYAWTQDFYCGYQDSNRKGAELRARAVRRLPI